MTTNVTELGSVLLLGAGGAATNVISTHYGISAAPGFANIKTRFADTSLSNIRDKVGSQIKEDDIYIVDGVDGSGKARSMNGSEIMKNIKPILHKFKPEDFNILVFSASGGSGGVIGSLLLKEMLEQDKTVICVVVGSEESKITIENTVKTMQTLDAISRKVGKPVIVSYWHNGPDASRPKNDADMRQTLTALAILASKQNAELDTTDVANFVSFERVTTVKEGLSLLYVTSQEEEAAKIEHPIAVASLMSKPGDTPTTLTPEYSCVGYPSTGVLKDTDLHFVISQHDVKGLYTRLDKRLKEFEQASSARVPTEALGGKADESGMVW